MLRSYLEHELNPLAVLQELHRTLQPGGVALIKVPNYASLNRRIMGRRWCGFRHPDHLNYFTPKTLRMIAERAGFECITNPIWYIPTNDNMRALLRKNMTSVS
jgi:predicted SAM-dependent methyltransferase